MPDLLRYTEDHPLLSVNRYVHSDNQKTSGLGSICTMIGSIPGRIEELNRGNSFSLIFVA
jgi:hypothetical protein